MQRKGWLIYNQEDAKRNQGFITWMLDEAKLLNIELTLVLKEELLYGVINHKLFIKHKDERSLPSFVIMRHIDPLLSKQFELLDIRVFNTSFIADCCNHKGKTHQLLAAAQIPMLDTIFTRTTESDSELLPFSYPVVVKEVEGRGGQQVYAVSSPNELQVLLASISSNEVIIQQMGDVPGKDVRVFVVGNEIIAATLRSSESSFKANVSLGGHSQLYELSNREKALVHKVIDQFHGELGFVGIDFLFSKDGSLLFNEIEDVVGSRTLSANSSINIVELYLNYIISSLNT